MAKPKADRRFRQLAKVLGDPKTLELLETVGERPQRFRDLQKGLDFPGNTLHRKLTALGRLGILTTKEDVQNRRQVQLYGLTPLGLDLLGFVDKYEKESPITPGEILAPGQTKVNHFRR